jgi:membrane protease YdiL (CAAX protease family)
MLGSLIGGILAVPLRSQGYFTEQATFGLAALFALLVSGMFLFHLAPKVAGPDLRRASATGAAWIPGRIKHILFGLVLGALLPLACSILIASLVGADAKRTLGPLTRLGWTPGFAQIAWVIGAVLFAPLFEELLFRGVCFGGFSRSLGKWPAALVTTSIFCLLHISEFIRFPAALVSIVCLAIVTLWMRLSFHAIGPAIAVHFSYNSVVVLLTLLAQYYFPDSVRFE